MCPFDDLERDIVAGLANGDSVKVLAGRLDVPWYIIRHRIARACKTIGVRKATALVAISIRKGWIG